MKKSFLIMAFIFIVFMSACSTEDTTANDAFDAFSTQWNKGKYEKMHPMLSSASKEDHDMETFTNRYKKIYNDINASNINVTPISLSDDELKKARKDKEAKLPFHVELDSIAGPIEFDYEATLVKEKNEDDKEEWLVDWDPGFIFPELKDGGKLGIQTDIPSRGEILDRNRMPLALNDTVREVGVVPENLGENEEANKKRIADLLNMSVEEVDAEINQSWVEPNLFVPLKTLLPSNKNLLQQLGEIEGVSGRDVVGRVYPLEEAAAHLVGYVGTVTAEDLEQDDTGKYDPTDKIGKRGLEQLFEKQLKGEPGATIYVSNEEEEDTTIAEKEVKNGETIQLTIDVNVQEKIYDSYDGDAGTASAINPKTGETLALVSSPAFNPNNILYGTNPNIWEDLDSDSQSPLLNRFKATYAPGSVIKPITAAIGLENGVIDPKEGLEINGLTWSNGKGWGNYKVRRVSEGKGPVDLEDALIRSDNIYFAMQAVDMGTSKFIKGLKNFGVGEEFPFIYPVNQSTISSNGEIDNEVLLANTSYGQGEIQLSSLHIALAYTPFLNNGSLLKPTLLLEDDDKQIWHKDIVSEEQAKHVQDILRKVVTEGTGKKADKADFPISGKTGTAELKLSSESKNADENGWFVGYPTDDQDILIAMMVEKTQGRGGSSFTTEKVTKTLQEIEKTDD